MHKRVALNAVALLGLFATTTVCADVQPGFYAGAGLGKTTIEIDELGFDEGDTGFKVFGGYFFNPFFALELTYFDGGNADQPMGFGPFEVSADALAVSGLARLPLNEAFSIFAKLGVASYDIDVNYGNGASDQDLTYGFGGAVEMGGSFELRTEYERIDAAEGSFNMVSVSALYRF